MLNRKHQLVHAVLRGFWKYSKLRKLHYRCALVHSCGKRPGVANYVQCMH